jgi:hypothetical protein
MEDETLSTGELAARQSYTGRHGHGGEPSAEPDVLLDVPQLKVEEILLDVEDLRAHISVQADCSTCSGSASARTCSWAVFTWRSGVWRPRRC